MEKTVKITAEKAMVAVNNEVEKEKNFAKKMRYADDITVTILIEDNCFKVYKNGVTESEVKKLDEYLTANEVYQIMLHVTAGDDKLKLYWSEYTKTIGFVS